MTVEMCVCGHHSHDHNYSASGCGLSNCWASLDGTNKDDYPVSPCPCREYQPALTTVTLTWERSTNLANPQDWTSGEVTTYTVRMYAIPRDPDDDEIDSDGFTADEADETDPQPYLDAENRLLTRHGLTRDSVSEVVTPF